ELAQLPPEEQVARPEEQRTLFLHGLATALRAEVSDFADRNGWRVVLLNEERPLIGQIAASEEAGLVVLLLRAEDLMNSQTMLDLGYAIGRFGRKHVRILLAEKLHGVPIDVVDAAGAWKSKLEL